MFDMIRTMGRRRLSQEAEGLRYLMGLVDDVARKHAGNSATNVELSLARQSIALLLAIADRVEASLADTLSDRHLLAINWLRRACARYEASLWQTAPSFSLAQ